MGLNGLTIAVPRGALMRDSLDVLDGLGVDTSEVRANDRRLLFGEVGIVTMRPSDVPTYVEAGAADLGITGKDVLAEQSEREVYELADLGYGRCVMVFATRGGRRPGGRGAAAPRGHARGDEVPADRRRLLRAHRPPGGDRRGQGLGRARAADRAGGGHRRPHRHGHDPARERPRHPRGDLGLDGAPDRQPGGAQAARPPRSTSCSRGSAMRRSCTVADAAAVAAEVRALVPAAASVAEEVAAIVEGVRLRGNAGVAEYERRFGGAERSRAARSGGGPFRVPPSRLAAALDALAPDVRDGPGGGDRQRRRRSPPRASTTRPRSTLDQGQTVRAARDPGPPRRGLRPRRPRAVSLVRRDGRRDGPGRRRGRGRRGRAGAPRHPRRRRAVRAPTRSTRWAARRRSRRSPTGRRASRAVDVIVGPGNLYVQEAKRQLSGRRRDRRLRRAERPLRDPHGRRGPGAGRPPTCARRPSTGRDSLVVAVSDDPALLPRRRHRDRGRGRPRRRAGVRGGARARAPAAHGADRGGARPARALAPAACSSARHAGDRVRRLRRGLQPHAADRGRRALRLRALNVAPLPPPHGRGADRRAGAAATLAPSGAAIARAEGFEAHAASMEARAGESSAMTRTARGQPQDGGDRRLADARPRRRRRGRPRAPASASSTTCSTCSPATGASTSSVQVAGDLQTGSHHTVEDTGIVLGQALDRALGDRAGIARYGHAVVPMDEARAACAIDVSGRPLLRVRRARRCRRGTSPASSTRPPRSSSAPSPAPRGSRCTSSSQAGTNAHHMIEACFKAFARALRGRGRGRSRPSPGSRRPRAR